MIQIKEYLTTHIVNPKRKNNENVIVATDDTLNEIVRSEIKRLGKDADLNHIDVSECTQLNRTFMWTQFRGDVSQWDVSNVTSMRQTFIGCTEFDGDLSDWDVSNVEDMCSMFAMNSSFKGYGLEYWNVSNVKIFDSTFNSCSSFNGYVSSWKISPKVKDMSRMFSGCKSFERDLSSWIIPDTCQSYEMLKDTKISRKHKFHPQRATKYTVEWVK